MSLPSPSRSGYHMNKKPLFSMRSIISYCAENIPHYLKSQFCVLFIHFSSQQRQRQQQQQQYYQQQHQQQGFSGEEEMNWNWDFMESSNNAPTTTLGWIGFGFFMFMGMILFMTVSVFSTVFSVFPNLTVFMAVFLVFLVIFSTSMFSCCGSRKKKIIQKEERPKCVVQPRNRQKENERHMFDDVYQQNENDIPIFENNLLGKDRICIVCRTAQSTKNSLILRNKYRKDPLLFCRSEIFLDDIPSEETPTDLNVIEIDDNGDVSTNIKSSQLNSNQSHVIAIVGRAVRWAEYSSPYPRNIPENIPNSSSDSFLQSNLISQTTSSTVEHSGSSSTEDHSTKNIPQNISGNSYLNNDIDEFDSWLNKLLCGEIVYNKTDLHPLPSLTRDISK